MGLERNKVVKALKAKGFREESRDHRWLRLYVEGKVTPVVTKVSHGKKKYRDLGDDLVTQMARQVYLSTPDFRKLIRCTLSAEGYVEKLSEKGHDFSAN